jgi:hypothetical protein
VLRRIFRPKKEEEQKAEKKKLHNEEFRNLYSSPDTISMSKSRRMG